MHFPATLISCDISADTTAIARRHATEAGVAEAVLPKVAPDGVIAADNTLFGTDDGDVGHSIQRFDDDVPRDERVECVLVPVRDGVTLIRKR